MDKDIFNYSKEFQQVKNEFKDVYQSIYNIISEQFTEIPDTKIIELQENFELDVSILRVLIVLSESYGLSPRLVALDFQEQIMQLTKLGDLHPEIGTFWIRFAIEEGSWIVLLRNEFPNRLRTRIQKLLDLEEAIWQKKTAEVEDGVYYLIETLNVGNTWIEAIIDLWINDHKIINKNELIENFCIYFYNAPISRKKQIFDGAKRALKSRIKDLHIVDDLNVNADFKRVAINYKNTITEELSSKNEEKGSFTYQYSNNVIYAILLETIIQKQIRQKKQSYKKIYDLQNQSEIIDYLNWNKLSVPLTDDQHILFQKKVKTLLTKFQGLSPLEIAHHIIKIISKEVDNPGRATYYYNKLAKQVSKNVSSKSMQKRSSDFVVSDLLNEKLAIILLEMRQEQQNKQKEILVTNGYKLDYITDLIGVTINRFKRLDDPKIIETQMRAFIDRIYKDLIDYQYTPLKAAEFIFQQIITHLPYKAEEITETFILDLHALTADKDNSRFMKEIDTQIKELLFDIMYSALPNT